MSKKTRILAGALAVVMTCRYSELGMVIASAENYGTNTYQSENMIWHSMIAEDIDLYYGTLYQGGIHSTDTEVSYDEAVQGMLYDRGEFMDYYNSFVENTQLENDFYSSSNLIINSRNTTVSCIAGSRISQQVNGESFEETENGILYSASGDITINASDAILKGLVYAPCGTVTINAGSVELEGLIVARHIIINADIIKEQPRMDLKSVYDEINIDFYPEILATCDENNQVEIYGGNVNVKNMVIYTRENDTREFRKIGETDGNEYTFSVSGEIESMDIRVECTNIFGQKSLSDISSFIRTDGVLENAVIDSDSDSLPNGYEIWDLGTDPFNSDSDGDGLPDGYEILYSHTEPLTSDSNIDNDGDGLTVMKEYERGTNPLYTDTDFDGIGDMEDSDPLTTEVRADQTKYQSYDFQPELGLYDHKKIYIDVDGNRQVQIFNQITKDEYYDDNAGSIFLRVSDMGNQVESVIFSDGEESDIETYEYDSEGRKITWAVNGDVYQYEYDDVENTAKTYLNCNFYSKVTWDDKDNPVKMEYANGDVMDYEYDENNQIQSVSINGKNSYEYEYEEDRLVKVNDLCNQISCEMTYDEENNLIGYKADNGFEKKLSYSEEAGVYTETCNYEGEGRNTTLCTTETEEGTRMHTSLPNGAELVTDSTETKAARYLQNGVQGIMLDEKTSNEEGLITELTNLLGTYRYEYDLNGNLETVYKNGVVAYQYIYDKNQQLQQYCDYESGLIYEYAYDDNYNLMEAVISDLNEMDLDKKTYEYGNDPTLGLQRYDGRTITYDASGNPVVYYNGWNFAWTSGRILENIKAGENIITYTYNSDGIRVGKTINGVETEYLLDESNQIMGEKSGDNILWYLYDGTEICGFEWQGNDYYYIKNAMGDVQGIADREGNVLCTYCYDVWGALIKIEGDEELGKKNPIRYRGYYFDEETGFYYLNTRYYDPEVKRFLNRDMLDNETNLYQYCYNNPVMSSDRLGTSSTTCEDPNVIVISNPYNAKYKVEYGKAVYYLNNKCIYFNCYMWALGTYSSNNKIYYHPGYKSSFDYRKCTTVSEIAWLAAKDLRILGHSVISCSSYSPSTSSLYKQAMAVRIGSSDYHFMKRTSYRGGLWWSFKAGQLGATFQLKQGLSPNKIKWTSYNYANDTWKIGSRAYTSQIWYIVYK